MAWQPCPRFGRQQLPSGLGSLPNQKTEFPTRLFSTKTATLSKWVQLAADTLHSHNFVYGRHVHSSCSKRTESLRAGTWAAKRVVCATLLIPIVFKYTRFMVNLRFMSPSLLADPLATFFIPSTPYIDFSVSDCISHNIFTTSASSQICVLSVV